MNAGDRVMEPLTNALLPRKVETHPQLSDIVCETPLAKPPPPRPPCTALSALSETERWHGSTIEYQPMPSLRDVVHDGWLRTVTIQWARKVYAAAAEK